MKKNKEKRFVDLDERVVATYYDDEHEEWSTKRVSVAEVLDSVVDTYTVVRNDPVPQKTGYWIPVDGYFTPGGDPVWQCSECGKGQHVYGIEASTYNGNISDHQWVACPNCEAKMINEEQEQKLGNWVDDGTELGCACSECGKSLDEYINTSEETYLLEIPKFCPNCGKRMRDTKET